MIEILDGFGCYQEKGGALTMRDYARIKNGEQSLLWHGRYAVSRVEEMARKCGIELTVDEVDLYATLRELTEEEVERREDGRSIRGLCDQKVLAEVLLLLGNEESLARVKGYWKNIFEEQ